MKVTVYGTPTCTYCKIAKEFLKESDIEFDYVDVSSSEERINELMSKTGGKKCVPVIDVDGEVLIGFDKDVLKEKLNLK